MVLAGALLAAPLFAEGLSSVTGGTGTAWAGKYSIDNLENDFANNGKTQTGDAKSSNRTGTVGPEHAGDEIYGGLATTPSSQPHNTIASENTLTIEAQGEAVFSDRIAAGYAGSWGAGHSTANGNTLTINGNEKTSFSVFARAGYADNWGPGNSEASGNKLFFNNAILQSSEASGLAGGLAKLNTGSKGSHVIANNNEVHISGEKTEIHATVNGGNAMTNNYAQNESLTQADGNKVFITGGARVVGAVYGGQINGNTVETENWYAEAHDNLVEIRDSFIGREDGSTNQIYVVGAGVYAWRVKEAHANKVVISHSILDADAKSYVIALSVNAFADPVEMGNNSVTFSNSSLDGYIWGTWISTIDRASVSNTTVEVSNGSNIGDCIEGDHVSAYSGDVIAEGERRVSVSDSTIGGYIRGLYMTTNNGNASAQGGSVSVSNSVVGSHILGDNVVAPKGSASVIGGSVSVSSGTTVKGLINGLSVNAEKAIAEGGSVSVSETTVGGDITGFSLSATGGDAIAQGGNVSVLNNSTVGGIITGASTAVVGTTSADSRASGNTLTIESSKVGSYVYGGLAMNGTGGIAEASGNTLNLKNVNASSLIMPSFAQNNGSGEAVAEGNTVTLQGGTYGDSIFVSYASAAVNTARSGRNTVTLQGGTYSGGIYGSYAYAAGNTAIAGGNTITLRGGNHEDSILGSYAYAAGNTAAGRSNVVTESATAASANIQGNTAIAEGNTVTLQGGTYSGSIFGSYAYAAGSAAAAGGNTVTLQGDDVFGGGSPSFSAQATVIWGSYALGGNKVYAPSSPNTLNFIDAKGMTAANIRNFSILKYTLPNMISQESVLSLTGGPDKKNTDISNASVSVAVSEVWGRDGGEFGFGGDKSPENDRIILLKNDNGLVSDGWKQEGMIIAREGVSLAFELAAATDDTSLYLYRPETFIDPSDPDHPHPNDTMVNPQTKALAEGWLAGLTLGIQAGNVAADQGIGAMRYAAVRLDRDGWLPFGVLEGGSLKYDSGSHIDLQSLSLLAGLGRGVSTDLGLLIVGGFFEYGTGSYKTHNSFDTMPSVDGSGNAWYMGGGLLASMDFKKTGDGHFYLEGSAHTGMLHNSFDGDALRDAYGRTAEFDTDTPYYNLHAGLGYLWNFAEDHSLDIYGKYYWTRVLGTDETLNTGDHVDFDDITSSRTRLGARYSYQATEHVSAYIGAAWEHEFEGVSDSSVFGYDIDSPKIRGDSGRGEIGLRFTPTDDLPLTVDIGVQGYAGKKEGVTGSLFVQYEF